jgi:membrane peptidoglycan carboxypeptidase
MKRGLQIGLGAAGALAFAAMVYIGFSFGSAEAKVERALPQLRAEIEEARVAGLDWESLPPGLRSILLEVEDPAFFEHGGLDFGTPGAGITTITQSLCKRVFWDEFRPGLAKWEQSLLAMALERELSKTDILTLFLRYAELGRHDGRWTIGVDAAARARFGQRAAALERSPTSLDRTRRP